MRETILAILEKNSKIDVADLAAMLGESEAAVANEISYADIIHLSTGIRQVRRKYQPSLKLR